MDAQNFIADKDVSGEIVDGDGDDFAVAGPHISATEGIIDDQSARISLTACGSTGKQGQAEALTVPDITQALLAAQVAPIDIAALEQRIATTKASLPMLEANAAAAEKTWKNASTVFMKRVTLENDLEEALSALKNAEELVEAFSFAATLATSLQGLEASKSNLERAFEERNKSVQDFAKAQQALANHECPSPEALREITEARNKANLVLNIARKEIFLAEQQMAKLSAACAITSGVLTAPF